MSRYTDKTLTTNLISSTAEAYTQGIPTKSRWIYRRMGIAARSFSGDYTLPEVADLQHISDSWNTIFVHREGFYDMLPEGLFHDLRLRASLDDTEALHAQLLREREAEAAARAFFAPFEQPYHQLYDALEQELRVGTGIVATALLELLLGEASGLALLSQVQLSAFLAHLPRLHSIRGDLPAAQIFLEEVLGLPVGISPAPQQQLADLKSLNPPLGSEKCCLGLAWCLGMESSIDTEDLLVTVGPVPSRSTWEGLGWMGGKDEQRVRFLCSLVLPVELPYTFEVKCNPAEHGLWPGSESVLGFNTHLLSLEPDGGKINDSLISELIDSK